jgi:replicative DNA helicase
LDTNLPQDPNPNEQLLSIPQSIQAEQAVLGSILLDTKAFSHVEGELRTNEFYLKPHRKIYAAMLELSQEGTPIDLITLVDRLQTKGWLDQVGSVSYLAQLADSVPTSANIKYYYEIIKDKYNQRQVIEAAKELSDSAYHSEDASQTISAAQGKLDKLSAEIAPRKAIKKIGDILIACFEDIEQRHDNRDGTGVTGINSGYDDLDRITAGFQNSDFIVVGARPSVGKTAFALNVSRNAAKITKKTIAIFSLEMSEKQLVQRMISAECNIDAGRLRTGHLIGDDWEKLTLAIGALNEYPIFIDDTPGITVQEIRSKCRQLKKENDLGMIVIDYLQLMEAIFRTGNNRQQEISEISRTLKGLAKELDIPIIALSQLSRGVEQRQDKRPMMSDLRESGSIEQDADIVAFLYRDDYYDKESEKQNIIEIIIAKQRNGPIGTVELAFLKQYNKFVSLDRGYVEKPSSSNTTYKKPDMYNKSR